MGTLSVCMIVRDEEARLGACLDSVATAVDEVVVVDTGSRDRTAEVARGRGAVVLDFPWRDDFAAARNAGLEAASSDWILWLDADDVVPPEHAPRLAALKEMANDRAFGFVLVNVIPGRFDERWLQLRMFPRDPRIRFERRVHAQVIGAVRACGLAVYFLDVEIVHAGHGDPAIRACKEQRSVPVPGRMAPLFEAARPVHDGAA